jgi:glycosyltransferase involved in cell wall biosynthesis
MALVTVIIPTHNRRVLLEKALQSVLRQTISDLEVIVVDEASSDDTPAYLAALDDGRVRVVRHDPAQGVVRARNAGVSAAMSPWLAFLDDDDLWAPGKLEAQLDAMTASGASWSCVGALIVDESLRVTDVRRVLAADEHPERLLQANVIPGGGSGVVVAADLLRDVGAFREDVKAAEDWECWIRLSQRSPIAPVDRPLLVYRRSLGSRSNAVTRHENAYRHIRRLHPSRDPLAAVSEKQMRFLAHQEMRNGQRGKAVRRLVQAARAGRRRNALYAVGMLLAPPRWERLLGRLHGDPRLRAEWSREAGLWLTAYR